MAKITVYLDEMMDPATAEPIRSKAPGTRRAIEAAEGRILFDTAQEVDLEMVNADGIVVRWPSSPKEE